MRGSTPLPASGSAKQSERCLHWHLSQRSFEEIDHVAISPESTVVFAQDMECDAVSFTYNEPTVFYEHMFDVAQEAQRRGMGTRFHPAYKLTSLPPTPIDSLERAARIAGEEGLQYVYVGNVPGHERNSTFCPSCGAKIVSRVHFAVASLDVIKGRCRFCDHQIPGIWR